MQKLPGILLIVGPIMFITGAFTLAPTGFFEATDLASQITAIENYRTEWLIAWMFLGISALIAAGGLVFFARNLHLSSDIHWVVRLGYVAMFLAVAGALCYSSVAIISITQSAEDFVTGLNGFIGFLGLAYGIFTLPAILFFGIVLFSSKRRILGGLLIIAPIFSVATGLYQIPLTNYIPLLIVGIALLVRPVHQGMPAGKTQLID